MTTEGWRPGDEPDIVLSPADRVPVIEMDREPDQRQLRLPWRRIGMVVALLVAAVGGYLVGRGDRPPAPAAAPTHAARPPSADTITPTGDRCAVPTSSTLQVGISITNLGDQPVTVSSVEVSLPMGGLRLRTQGWGACGQTQPAAPRTVQPNQIVWLNATFDLPDGCPQPYPVGFTVVSTAGGGEARTPILSFPDLSTVDFPSC